MDPDGRFSKQLAKLRGRAPGVHRFLTSEERKHRWGREVLSVVLVVLGVLLMVYLYAGQMPPDPPVVVVESGSMMHCANGRGSSFQGDRCEASSWGRLGTIDPGDVIVVRDVDGGDDVTTFADAGRTRYGAPGDVVIYRPLGSEQATPIIHRALFYVELHGDGTVSMPALEVHRQMPGNISRDTLLAGGVPPGGVGDAQRFLENAHRACRHLLDPAHPDPDTTITGFVTAGDNNPGIDNASIIGTDCPVQVDWIIGKARAEIPWIGLLKLRFTDPFHYSQAPSDVRGLMWLSVGLILFGPFLFDMAVQGVRRVRHRDEP